MRLTPFISHEHRLTAADGWSSSVLELRTVAPPRAVAIVGHAMMADRRTLTTRRRDTLSRHLIARGVAVLAPDLRGHGESGPLAHDGGDWSYDAIVADTASYVALARELHPDLPLVLVGHSLFGHTALAWLGRHPSTSVAGVVLLGVNIWNRRFNHGALRWKEKQALMLAARALIRVYGYMPAARLRFGSADEAPTYWRALDDWVAHDRWCSADGHDYYAALAGISAPVLHVVSDGDALLGNPDDALAFSAIFGARRTVLHVGPRGGDSSLASLAPTHMGLLTDPRAGPVWQQISDWVAQQIAR